MIGVCVPSDSDMTHEQIDLFITQTRARFERIGVVLEEIMIMGGEPLVHPHFIEIYRKLKEELVPRYCLKLVLCTNGTLPIPEIVDDEIRVSPPETKLHSDMYVSPTDMGWPLRSCNCPIFCGIEVNAFGYFPCSAGYSIIVLAGMQEEILYDFPDALSVWDYSKICMHCTHSDELRRSPVYSVLGTNPHTVPKSPVFEKWLSNKDNIKLKRLGQ